MNDKILFRLITINDETETLISCFYSTSWVEPLKMFSFLKENNLPYDITVVEEDLFDHNYKNHYFHIEDINIQFGGKVGLNAVDIYVEAF